MPVKNVAILGTIDDVGHSLLAARDDFAVTVTEQCTPANVLAAVADAHAVLVRTARLDAAAIAAAPKLQLVSRHGVGFDAVDVEALSARRIPLSLAIHGNAVSVAEHFFDMLLTLSRRSIDADRETRNGNFDYRNGGHAEDIATKRLLIVGFGRIGTRVARRALAFEMAVDVYDPYVAVREIEAAGCRAMPDLDAALDVADVVTVHCPLNEETTGLIGTRQLARLHAGAIVINCARGGIVDEAALVDALRRGALRGAGLDVFAGEPTWPDVATHPLFAAGIGPLLLSPHSAGTSRQAAQRTARNAAQNIIDYYDGRLDPAAVQNLSRVELPGS